MAATPQPPRAGVLTLSDAGSRGEREDTSGPAIYERLTGIGVVVAQTAIIPMTRKPSKRRCAPGSTIGSI